jgi:hypothetical protein
MRYGALGKALAIRLKRRTVLSIAASSTLLQLYDKLVSF